MGAQWFEEVAEGKTAQEAFDVAVENARYEYGHGGYTGTIAEKIKFVMIRRQPMSLEDAEKLADKLWDEGDKRIVDKWGPCGCIPLDDGRFYFFGNASS